jgi:hypothetical protein
LAEFVCSQPEQHLAARRRLTRLSMITHDMAATTIAISLRRAVYRLRQYDSWGRRFLLYRV